MIYIEIKLETSGLDFLIGNVGARAEKLLGEGASKIEKRWKDYITAKDVIDTGAYLNSVHVQAEHKAFERIISDGVEYGIFQEYGTVKTRINSNADWVNQGVGARPCATPAVEDERKPLTESWGQLFKL